MQAPSDPTVLQLGSVIRMLETETELEAVTEPVALELEPEPVPAAAVVMLVILKQTPEPTMST